MSDLDVLVREKRFPAIGAAPAHLALQDVRITARHGELVCLLGPSGCGKTTLLNIVAGLDRDYDGHLTLPSVPGRAAPVIGYVFQSPRLLPWRTVRQNVELVLSDEQAASGIADELLEAAGLAPFCDAYPQRLSLGMSRRVALVRAFAVKPDLMLLDEPFVSLDEPTARRLRALLLKLWQARPTTALFVSHNLREAIYLADRIVLFSAAPGRVVADLPLTLPRAERARPGAVEALREELLRERPELFRGL
ncbi:MAG: ABC transporter ATP-binding protein [Kiloniellales bacterium]